MTSTDIVTRTFLDPNSIEGDRYYREVWAGIKGIAEYGDHDQGLLTAANILAHSARLGIPMGDDQWFVSDWEFYPAPTAISNAVSTLAAALRDRNDLVTLLTPAHVYVRSGIVTAYERNTGRLIDQRTGVEYNGDNLRPLTRVDHDEDEPFGQREPNAYDEDQGWWSTTTNVPFPEGGVTSWYWPLCTQGHTNPYHDEAPSTRAVVAALREEIAAMDDALLFAGVMAFVTGVMLSGVTNEDGTIFLGDDWMTNTPGRNYWAHSMGKDFALFAGTPY